MATDLLHLKVDPTNPAVQTGKIYIDDAAGNAIEVGSAIADVNQLECKFVPSLASRQMFEVSYRTQTPANKQRPIRILITLKKPIAEELCITVVPASHASLSLPQ